MGKPLRARLKCAKCKKRSLPQNRPGGALWYYCRACARALGVPATYDGKTPPQKKGAARKAQPPQARPAPAPPRRPPAPGRTRPAFSSERLRALPAPVCIFTAICQPDADLWGAQYLAEMGRMGLPFCVHFDKCAAGTRRAFRAHPLCAGVTAMDAPGVLFTERHKQALLDLVASLGYPWAFALDADEVFGRDGPADLPRLAAAAAPDVTSVAVRYAHLWDSPAFVRVGHLGPGYREKLIRLDCKLVFRSDVVNGPTRVSPGGSKLPHKEARSEFPAVLHYGLISRELRRMHKERWDRLYGACTSDGRNPYGLWRDACDESATVDVAPNPYL